MQTILEASLIFLFCSGGLALLAAAYITFRGG
jgi:hypothetical protein